MVIELEKEIDALEQIVSSAIGFGLDDVKLDPKSVMYFITVFRSKLLLLEIGDRRKEILGKEINWLASKLATTEAMPNEDCQICKRRSHEKCNTCWIDAAKDAVKGEIDVEV